MRDGAVFAVAAVLVGPDPVAAQCIMCRTALASPEGQQLAAAFRSGILFLLAAPLMSFAAVAWLAVRRQRRRLATYDHAWTTDA